LSLLQVGYIEEQSFELNIGDDAVLGDVVLLHDLVELVLGDLVADLVHGSYDVLLRDAARSVSVKLTENGLELVVVEERLHVERCNQELRVVYFLVPEVVNLVDDLLDLVIGDVDVALLNCQLQFVGVDQACAVLVDLLEVLSQGFDAVLVCHLHQHVHRRLLQLRHSAERLKALQNRRVNRHQGLALPLLLLLLHRVEPVVLEGLAG